MQHVGTTVVYHPRRPHPETIYKDMIEPQAFADGWDGYDEPSMMLN